MVVGQVVLSIIRYLFVTLFWWCFTLNCSSKIGLRIFRSWLCYSAIHQSSLIVKLVGFLVRTEPRIKNGYEDLMIESINREALKNTKNLILHKMACLAFFRLNRRTTCWHFWLSWIFDDYKFINNNKLISSKSKIRFTIYIKFLINNDCRAF